MKKRIKLFILGLSFIPFSVGTIDISFTTRIEHKKMLNADDNKFYALSKESYEFYDINTLQQYLYDGGIIINDYTVDKIILNNYFGIEEALLPTNNCYWTGLYFNGVENAILKFELGYYGSPSYNIIDERVVIEDIYSEINDRISISILQRDNTIVYNDYIIKILYKDSSTTKMCTYEISTQIIDNYKSNNGDDTTGNYSVSTSISISPEANYCVNNYTATIAFNSNVNVLSESITNITSSYQNLSKTETNSYTDVVTGNSSSDQHGSDFKFRSVYEIESLNDYSDISLSTKLNSLSLKDNGWWIFQKTYTMDSANSEELFIKWNYNGLI